MNILELTVTASGNNYFYLMKTSLTFDDFFAQFPSTTQEKLRKIRALIQSCAPEAKECIKYGIPTFDLYGNLVHFSAYEKHIGFYPGSSGISAFSEEIAAYKSAKGSVQFPLNQEIPYDLIKRITMYRIEENTRKKQEKKK